MLATINNKRKVVCHLKRLQLETSSVLDKISNLTILTLADCCEIE